MTSRLSREFIKHICIPARQLGDNHGAGLNSIDHLAHEHAGRKNLSGLNCSQSRPLDCRTEDLGIVLIEGRLKGHYYEALST